MKKGSMKQFVSLLVIGSILLILPVCLKAADVAEVKIGAILPLSGESTPQGTMSKRGMDMALEEINSAGGIKSLGGAKLKVIYSDSQTKPQVAVSEAERLISQENVAFLVGAYNSGVTLPASEVAERYKKVWWCPVSSDLAITNRGFKYVFRLAENSHTRVLAQLTNAFAIIKQSGVPVKTFACAWENNAYGQSLAVEWKKIIPENGYQIVLEEAYDPKTPDISPVVAKIKAANADIVMIANSYMPATIMMAKAFVEQKVRPKAFFATSGATSDPDYVKNAGDAALGVFDVSGWDPDVNRPFSKEVAKKFYDKYGVAMNNETSKDYVGMYVVKDVLERAGSLDSEKLREAFAATNITEGIPQMYAKRVHFDSTGTFPEISSLITVQFQRVNGKVERVTVWPPDQARPGYKPIFPYTYDQ
jgi:branched-chain amino acid transport system substrate-binding protein